MKIHELKIRNVRGIVDLTLQLDGENLAIWGPNGTGKSGVVDAIDFLLTGDISRLAGEGTGELDLSRHGHHVDSKPSDAYVQVTVSFPGQPNVTVRRNMDDPEDLDCPTPAREAFERVAELARRGQHVLTRRDILRFIAVTPGDQDREIEQLLDLSDIGTARRVLRKVAGDLKREAGEAQGRVHDEQARAAAAIGITSSSGPALLQAVNEQREIIGGVQIKSLEPGAIIEDIVVQTGDQPSNNRSEAKAAATSMRDLSRFQESVDRLARESFGRTYDDLQRDLATLAEPAVARALHEFQLTELGISLLDASGRCPLCETIWDPDELREHLESKHRRASEANALRDRISQRQSVLETSILDISAPLDSALEAIPSIYADETAPLVAFQLMMREFVVALRDITKHEAVVPLPSNMFTDSEQLSSVRRTHRTTCRIYEVGRNSRRPTRIS